LDERKHADIFRYDALAHRGFITMKNKSLPYKIFMYFLIWLSIFMMGNCISSFQEQSDFRDRTALPSQTLEENIAITATISPVPSLTGPTSPPPIIELTWTPLPTIQPNELDAFIDSMNTKCELPCWGNITPEKTSELEAKHVASSFGTIIESTSIYFSYREKPTVIDFTFRDDVVSRINLPSELTAAYELSNFLSRYGMPEDVRIEVIPETAEGTSWFYLAVFYPQKGLLAVFSGEANIINSKVNACFENIYPDLYLVGSHKYSLEQMSILLDPILWDILEPLEALTEINKDQFYHMFSQKNQACLVTRVQVP
jgi:hypothetical protein